MRLLSFTASVSISIKDMGLLAQSFLWNLINLNNLFYNKMIDLDTSNKKNG